MMLDVNKTVKAITMGAAFSALMAAAPLASADKTYSQYDDGKIPMNSYGECWQTGWGIPPTPECGGAMPAAEPKMAGDADNDGVPDDKDKCPHTAPGVPVDADGCDLDSDHDGVPDYKDMCPRTPAGTKVDSKGCPDKIVLNNVLFDVNSAVLKSDARSTLDEAATTIKNAGAKGVRITGHTDSTGEAAYNEGLSKRRASAVADYLAGRGLSRSMMSTNGMGEAAPVADNSTRAGRALNRRVEIDLIK